jgi:hypothetical protein
MTATGDSKGIYMSDADARAKLFLTLFYGYIAGIFHGWDKAPELVSILFLAMSVYLIVFYLHGDYKDEDDV